MTNVVLAPLWACRPAGPGDADLLDDGAHRRAEVLVALDGAEQLMDHLRLSGTGRLASKSLPRYTMRWNSRQHAKGTTPRRRPRRRQPRDRSRRAPETRFNPCNHATGVAEPESTTPHVHPQPSPRKPCNRRRRVRRVGAASTRRRRERSLGSPRRHARLVARRPRLDETPDVGCGCRAERSCSLIWIPRWAMSSAGRGPV